MVFPLSDDNTDRRTVPVVNFALIAANIFVFVVLQGMGTNEKFTMAFACVPAEIVTGKDLITQDRVVVQQDLRGGQQQVMIPGLQPTPLSVYITLLTSMFMHGGLAHIAGNLWFLWIFGDNVEDDMGHARYLAFYFICGILASLTHVLLSASGQNAQIPSLGASGAISGILGAYLVLHPHRQVTVLMLRVIVNVPGYMAVGLWFLFQLVSGLGILGGTQTGGVAYGAHIGGFIAGAALARPFLIGRPLPLRDRRPRQASPW
jgi:membrane associated rhomboid family serine protease